MNRISRLSKAWLLLIAASLVSPLRAPWVATTFVFDWLILPYILSVYVYAWLKFKKLVIEKGVLGIMFFGNLLLLPAIALSIFSKSPGDSVVFLGQFWFILNALPLFVGALVQAGHLETFLKYFVLLMLVVFLGYFFCLFITPTSWGQLLSAVYELESDFGFRFTLGEFTPNEMSYYLIFICISLRFLGPGSFSPIILLLTILFGGLAFFMTLSKTLFLQILLAACLVLTQRQILVLFVMLFITAVIWVGQAPDIFWLILKDFSTETSSNSIRLEMLYAGLQYLDYSVFFPTFHAEENIMVSGSHITSIHNVFLSVFVNFGLITFLLFTGGFIWISLYNWLGRKLSLGYVWGMLTLTFFVQPLLTARVLWLPVVLLVWLSLLPRQDAKNLDNRVKHRS